MSNAEKIALIAEQNRIRAHHLEEVSAKLEEMEKTSTAAEFGTITPSVYVDAEGNPWDPSTVVDMSIFDDDVQQIFMQISSSASRHKVRDAPFFLKNLDQCFNIFNLPGAGVNGKDNKAQYKFHPITEDRVVRVIRLA